MEHRSVTRYDRKALDLQWSGGCTGSNIAFEWATSQAVNAPWVVLVHGVGLRARVWRPWAPQLIDQFNVVALDVPGYGSSPLQGSLEDRNLASWSRAVLDVVDELDVSSAYFVGESLGGTTVLQIAATQPERVQAAIVCSTGFKGELIPGLHDWAGIFARDGSIGWSTYMNERRFRPTDSAEVQQMCDYIQRETNCDVIIRDAEMLSTVDLTNALPEIPCPVLAIEPGDSPFVSRKHAFALEAAIRNCELVLFGASRHGLAFAYASEASTTAREFIARSQGVAEHG